MSIENTFVFSIDKNAEIRFERFKFQSLGEYAKNFH